MTWLIRKPIKRLVITHADTLTDDEKMITISNAANEAKKPVTAEIKAEIQPHFFPEYNPHPIKI
ncbi:MAG: hypothetical protein QXM22_03690 [Candidatus Bathyarchaeia archaeon]